MSVTQITKVRLSTEQRAANNCQLVGSPCPRKYIFPLFQHAELQYPQFSLNKGYARIMLKLKSERVVIRNCLKYCWFSRCTASKVMGLIVQRTEMNVFYSE